MAEKSEKIQRVNLAVTPEELAALELIERLHPGKYDGTSSVLRDYSLADAVAFRQRALQLQSAP